MKSLLDVEKYYHIELYDMWNRLSFDMLLIGIGNPSTIIEMDDKVDIKQKFFLDYNMSTSTYLKFIQKNTLIYIGKPILTYDPIKIEEDKKERIYIPETLVNYAKTYSYDIAKRYKYNVTTGIRMFDDIIDEDDFIRASKRDINKSINNIKYFIGDPISVSESSSEILTTRDKVLDLVNERERLYDQFMNSKKQNQDNVEASERNLYIFTERAKLAENKYLDKAQILTNQINDVNNVKINTEETREKLMRVRSIMEEMIRLIKTGEFNQEDFPSFEEMYSQAANSLFGVE